MTAFPNNQFSDCLEDPLARLRKKFQQVWGYEDFRSPQGEIAAAILQKRDIVVVMPTGGGKSVCFQLPALLSEGVTLVVSPLVALMENQVQELKEKRLPAACLHSELGKSERRRVLWLLSQNRLRLLYLSPETLLSKAVWAQLTQPHVVVNALVLDEAHCLTQWGDSFRPAYRRLGAVRPALLACKPKGTKIAIAAFTATADPATQSTLQSVLRLRSPNIVRLNPYRNNLQLNVKTVWTPRGRKRAMLRFIQQQKNASGLVYARTRRGTESIAQWLKEQNHSSVKSYHGGMSAFRRRHIEADWIEGRCQLVVCTSAFGMGINKSDCRFVVHYEVPSLIAEYVQEVGRGGRDGQPAIALSFVSEPTGLLAPEDSRRWKFFAQRTHLIEKAAVQLSQQIPQAGHIDTVKRQFKGSEQALALLHRNGQLEWQDPFTYRLLDSTDRHKDRSLVSAVDVMKRYLFSRGCRWQGLLREFGFEKAAENMQCGTCDRCRRKGLAAS